jgi:hypothetical protein
LGILKMMILMQFVAVLVGAVGADYVTSTQAAHALHNRSRICPKGSTTTITRGKHRLFGEPVTGSLGTTQPSQPEQNKHKRDFPALSKLILKVIPHQIVTNPTQLSSCQ